MSNVNLPRSLRPKRRFFEPTHYIKRDKLSKDGAPYSNPPKIDFKKHSIYKKYFILTSIR